METKGKHTIDHDRDMAIIETCEHLALGEIGRLRAELAMLRDQNKWLRSGGELSAKDSQKWQGIALDYRDALKQIAESDKFNGGTFVKELQDIARAALASARGRA